MARKAACTALVIATCLITALPTHVAAQDIKVTLLGTGTPSPVMNRFGPAILVEAGGQKFLFDAGRGAMQRLTQIGVSWQAIDGVFLTHLHSDHIVGFPDLWLTGWLVGGGRNRPLRVSGPIGTKSLMSHLSQAFAFDIGIRQSDDRAAPDGAVIVADEIGDGVVSEKNGVTVTAFAVDHAPVSPAFGYRVDYRGHSVVLSGDTRVSENLISHAQGVDLLVHEVMSPEILLRMGQNPESVRRRVAHHTTAAQAGEVFARAKPRLAMFSHIGPPEATDQDLLPAVRKSFAGRVEVGEDLMVIEIGASVDVRRPAKATP